MPEFKENLSQREELKINPDNQGQFFDKSNLYKAQISGMENYSAIGQSLFALTDKVNNQQKQVLANKIRINFDTFSKNEQQMMSADPKTYFGNFAENQSRGKKQLEDTFKQINNAGLFNKAEMDNLALEMQGQYNAYFMQNNMNYSRYQKESTIASTREVNETYKDLIQGNADDIMGVNRYLNLMEETTMGLGDFLEPEAMLKEQMEFLNYKDTVAQSRIENFLDNSAATLEKDLQRKIANGATLEEITALRETYVNDIKTRMIDPDFSLGLVGEDNFESTVSKNFLNPVVNKAFDNAQNQTVVNNVFNQVMSLVEKTGKTDEIEKNIKDITLKDLEKLYKDGNIPAEKVMQIKAQVLGKLDEVKASDMMKKYIGKGTPENFMKMQKKAAELQLDPQKNGLSGYGNIGGAVSSALQMEQINVSENAMKAARAVVRSRGGATSSRKNSSTQDSTITTINSDGVLIKQSPNLAPNKTYKGNLFSPVTSQFTMQGANAIMGVMRQNGVLNSTTGGTKQSRKMYKDANNVVKTWNERGTGAIQTFMPQLMRDGVVTQTNQFAPLLTSNGGINKGTAKAGLELAYTSFTNVSTRDANNNLMFSPKQMYYELVQRSNQKDAEGKRSMRRFTLFNEFSPEIQALSQNGYGANMGADTMTQMNGIKAIHNYFSDPRMLDPEMSDIAIKDSMHILGYNALVTELATRGDGNAIKDEALLQRVIEYQMTPDQLKELSKEAVNVIGYDEQTFKGLWDKSFTSYVEDDPVAAEFMKNFVADTVDNPENKEILDSLNNVMKGYVIKETMKGRMVDEKSVKQFAGEIMQSFLSDYHVYTDGENKTTFFIDKEQFDPKFNEYMVAHADSLKNDPSALENFQTLMNNMSDKDKDFQIGRNITNMMNKKLDEAGAGYLKNSAAPEAITVFTAQDANQYSQMLGREVKVGDMLFTVKNADKMANVPIFITQDEVMESMMSELQDNSRFSANWQRATKNPKYNSYGAMQVDMNAYYRR